MDTDANEKVGKNFKVREFACKDGSQAVFIDDYLVSILDILRNKIGFFFAFNVHCAPDYFAC